jgi:phosphate transport system substrate-binding protein
MRSSMHRHLAWVCATLLAVSFGCGRRAHYQKENADKAIRVEGSDTMVNVAQAWAEQYHQKHPTISVQVLGGGSGQGIASLIDGNCDLANTSRKMKESEIQRARASRNGDPKEIIVGYDALAIYVHKDNPLDSIAKEDLADIYGEDGKLTKWSQLGVKGPLAEKNIIRVSRQSSSGTYTYFREVVLGPAKDYKLGSIDQSGSKDVVALVSRTPAAIGYSGMGYSMPDVKMLKVSQRRGEPGVMPTVENAKNNSYPITRPLQIYVVGEPKGAVKEYLDWILSPEGQTVVLNLGYVPVKLHE